jgi:nucleotide-binding universal stress UspA family protein
VLTVKHHREESAMDSPIPKPLVIGVDGSVESLFAVDWGAREAAQRALPLELLHAWDADVSSETLQTLVPLLERQSADVLKAAADRARSIAPGVEIRRRHTMTRPAPALLHASLHADSIVLGSRGPGRVRAAVARSTSMQVAGHAASPVVVVKGDSGPQRNHAVIVGVDASEGCRDALGFAFTHAAAHGAELRVVNTWSVGLVQGTLALNAPIEVWEKFEDAESDVIRTFMAPWTDKYPDVTVTTHISQGPAADALVRASNDASLLVVGSRGRGGFRSLLLGSVSRAVLHLAHCPVAVVRGTGDHRTAQDDPVAGPTTRIVLHTE